MLVTPFDRLDAEFFNQVSSSVRVIATYSVGLDHIDLDGASARYRDRLYAGRECGRDCRNCHAPDAERSPPSL
jgi:phosphoglycerate dehydrogenase-like enzyme